METDLEVIYSKTIEELGFNDTTIPEEKKKILKQFFFAGATTMYKLVTDLGETIKDEISQEKVAIQLGDIGVQVEIFWNNEMKNFFDNGKN